MKKEFVFLFCTILLSGLVLAQSNNIEVSTIKEQYKAGELITLKVSLLDYKNNPINIQTTLVFEDAGKTQSIEKIVDTNKIVEVDLGKGAISGYWNIKAEYENAEPAKTLFYIEANELIKFEIQEDNLIITNVGNSVYSKTIQIVIGETVGTKIVELDIGETMNLKLVAPDGKYNIKVTDGQTTLTKGKVALTGEVIGVIDEKSNKRSVINTLSPDDLEKGNFVKNNKFIYVFILAVIGATILIAIERKFKKKAGV